MESLGYDIQIGEVMNVVQATDVLGDVHPTVQVMSLMDGSMLDIPLTSAAWDQHMPVPGYMACFVRYKNYPSRILKFWGRDEDIIRKGTKYGLFPGEVFIQSPSGYSFLKFDRNGRVLLASGDQASTVEMDENGLELSSNRVYINTPQGIMMEFSPTGEVLLTKASPDGEVQTQLTIDKEANFSITSTKNVSIKAPNIFLDGTVWSGAGATDPAKRPLFGDVVTAGIGGTHPFDFVTGLPIQGSSSVKVAK